MSRQADKIKENKNLSAANAVSQQKSVLSSTPPLSSDNRPEAIAQKKLSEAIDSSPRVQQLKAYQEMADNFSSQIALRHGPLSAQSFSQPSVTPVQRKENDTGLTDNLKSGIENLSGYSMDDVKVHYNSDKPAQLQAHAFAQGTDIHIAPGQEQHLPHEAWHVVQQKQGRVAATAQLKGQVNINDDAGLEQEADVMGAKAMAQDQQMAVSQTKKTDSGASLSVTQRLAVGGADYTLAEKRASITHAETAVTKKKAKPKDYAASMAEYLIASCGGAATAYAKKGSLEKECEKWWNRPSLVADVIVLPPRTALVSPTINYDSEHGDLHFISNPTDTKSAWTLDKGTATTTMETEIKKHLNALGVNSRRNENNGWSPFYITAQHSAVTGAYHGQKKKQQWPTTDHYTIQVQVNYTGNLISYHGFPDERIEGQALGCSINKTDATKLT